MRYSQTGKVTPAWIQAIAGLVVALIAIIAFLRKDNGGQVSPPPPSPSPAVTSTAEPDTISRGRGVVRLGDEPRDESITFPVSYDRGESVIEGRAIVYVAGAPATNLSVDSSRPFHTANVTVSKPGTYAYRIELREVQLLTQVNVKGISRVDLPEKSPSR